MKQKTKKPIWVWKHIGQRKYDCIYILKSGQTMNKAQKTIYKKTKSSDRNWKVEFFLYMNVDSHLFIEPKRVPMLRVK